MLDPDQCRETLFSSVEDSWPLIKREVSGDFNGSSEGIGRRHEAIRSLELADSPEIAKVGRPALQVALARAERFHTPHEEQSCSDLVARSAVLFQEI
jgi:hypothetical protein